MVGMPCLAFRVVGRITLCQFSTADAQGPQVPGSCPIDAHSDRPGGTMARLSRCATWPGRPGNDLGGELGNLVDVQGEATQPGIEILLADVRPWCHAVAGAEFPDEVRDVPVAHVPGHLGDAGPAVE